MTMNPLVEKILHSTVEKSLDMEILNELEFTPDDACELSHKSGATTCSGKATHWAEYNYHPDPPIKICHNAFVYAQERIDDPLRRCKDCVEDGTPHYCWQCWHVEPIVK